MNESKTPRFSALNPFVRSAAIREVIYKNEECIAYDARIFHLISGELMLTVDGKKARFSSGNLIYIPAGTPYKFKGHHMMMATVNFDLTDEFSEIEPPSPVLTAYFDPSNLHRCSIPPFDKVLRVDDADDERENFGEIAEIAGAKEGEWQAEASAMLKLILIRLAAITDEGALPPRMVKNLDSYIRENRKDEISNTELGAIFGYHPFYISNKLKTAKGITLHQYIISYRLKIARALLEYTDKSVGEIAEEAGFSDPSYFTKSFKAAMGMTPKEYRNRFKEDFI